MRLCSDDGSPTAVFESSFHNFFSYSPSSKINANRSVSAPFPLQTTKGFKHENMRVTHRGLTYPWEQLPFLDTVNRCSRQCPNIVAALRLCSSVSVASAASRPNRRFPLNTQKCEYSNACCFYRSLVVPSYFPRVKNCHPERL